MLELPTLASEIPTTLAPVGNAERFATLARSLHGAGILNEDTLPKDGVTQAEATCTRAFAKWLEDQTKGIYQLGTLFQLIYDRSNGDFAGGGIVNEGRNPPEGAVALVWLPVQPSGGYSSYFGRSPNVNVGPALKRLEAMVPGMGATVLSTIEGMGSVAPFWTPATALQRASQLYWKGEPNEEKYLASLPTAEKREARRAEMVTRAHFAKGYPEWALNVAGAKTLGDRQLGEIARTTKSDRIQKVVAATLRLRKLLPLLPEHGKASGPRVQFSGALTWREDDVLMRRVLDDWHKAEKDVKSPGYLTGRVYLDPAEPGDFVRWKESMKPWFEALHLVDDLTKLFCLRHWRTEEL